MTRGAYPEGAKQVVFIVNSSLTQLATLCEKSHNHVTQNFGGKKTDNSTPICDKNPQQNWQQKRIFLT